MDAALATAAQIQELWHDDPVKFAMDTYGFEPDPYWQDKAMLAVARNPLVAIGSGKGVGKTALGAMLCKWWLSTRVPATVLLTSVKREQILDTYWREFSRWEMKKKPAFDFLKFRQTESRIVLEGWEETNSILPRTASAHTSESLQGIHDENILTLVDEASGIHEKLFEAILGTMSTRGSRILLTGNRTRSSGFFEKALTRGSGWWTMIVDARNARAVDPKFVDMVRNIWGEDSSQYRVNVLGLPPHSDPDQAIPRDAIERCLENDALPFADYPEHWGLDIAGPGMHGDRTALAFRKGNVQPRPVKWWRGLEGPGIEDMVLREWLAAKDKPAIIAVDADGIGSPVYDYIRRRIPPMTAVIPVKSRWSADDKNEFPDRSSELLWRAREWCLSPTSVLCDQDLADELTWYRVEAGGKGLWAQISKKPSRGFNEDAFDVTIGSASSPDLGDAWKNTFARRDMPARRISGLLRPPVYSTATWQGHA